jgi:hypothetical protein
MIVGGHLLAGADPGTRLAGTSGQTDVSLAVLMGLAIGLVPLAIAYGPRVVALAAEHKRGQGTIPPGVTPFVAALLSGLGLTDLLGCGLMWLIARAPHQDAAGKRDPAPESSAEGYLLDSLAPPGSLITNPRDMALSTLRASNPARFEVRAVMAGVRSSAGDDARNLGLLRDGARIRKLLLGLAVCELALAYFIEGALAVEETLLLAGLLTVWAALHVDPRSFAGANLTGDLRRLRGALREAARATGSLDSAAVRALVPAAATAAETEVWAMAVGCRTAGSEQAAARLRSLSGAASGRPRVIRYTEAVLLTGGEVAHSVTAPVRAIWRFARPRRPGPDGAAPVLW